MEYGLSFFTYYEHFPIPGILKNVYKGIIGVWGLPGTAALIYGIILMLTRKENNSINGIQPEVKKGLVLVSTAVIVLYTVSFIRVPLKSAFMIPLIPFVVLLLSLMLNEKKMRSIGILIMVSSFLFGINLAEANRGSETSPLAITTTIGGQKIALDPLQGLLLADRSKRIQRTAFARQVLKQTRQLKHKNFIIAGWWLADLQYLNKGSSETNVIYRYYTDEPELKWYQAQGYQIYYLEDQWEYNDLRFGKSFTRQYAKELSIN
jgi:hypothetical protein